MPWTLWRKMSLPKVHTRPRALRAALLHAAHKPGVEIQLSQQPMAGKLHPRVRPPERNAIR
jgi:hypothetical protein